MMPASSEKVRMKSSAKNGFAKSEKNPAKKSPNDSKNPFSGLPATVFVFKIGLHFAITFSPYRTIIPHFTVGVKMVFSLFFGQKLHFLLINAFFVFIILLYVLN